MAIDFMTALRERARSQERGARLSGRPLTQAETAAPYVAMADTAGDRNARGRALQLQEQAQTTQAGQFGQTLEFNKTTTAENQRLEQERLTAQKEMEAARLAETVRQTNLQVEAANKAQEGQEGQQALTGTLAGGMVDTLREVHWVLLWEQVPVGSLRLGEYQRRPLLRQDMRERQWGRRVDLRFL